MTVYADILMLVNFLVDYFLILLAAKFLHIKPKLTRLLLSSAVGGIFSLYIFLPQTIFIIQLLIQIFMCMILCLLAFGFDNIKSFFRAAATLFGINFAYSGAMIAFWLVFRPYGMVINNSVVYFNVSPLFLILFSVLGYFMATFLRKILKKPFAQNTYCEVTVVLNERKLKLQGIADTGNSLTDVFGVSQIFITEGDIADALLGEEKNDPARFRKIPCNTITGESLLDGYRIDRAEVFFNNKNYFFKNPILAISSTPLDGCKIIVNPENLN